MRQAPINEIWYEMVLWLCRHGIMPLYTPLGGKAFDADWLRAELDARGAAAVIPPKANRKAVNGTGNWGRRAGVASARQLDRW